MNEDLIKEMLDYVDYYVAKCQAAPTHKDEYYDDLRKFIIKKSSKIFGINEERLEQYTSSYLYQLIISWNTEQDPEKRKLVAAYLALVNLLNIKD